MSHTPTWPDPDAAREGRQPNKTGRFVRRAGFTCLALAAASRRPVSKSPAACLRKLLPDCARPRPASAAAAFYWKRMLSLLASLPVSWLPGPGACRRLLLSRLVTSRVLVTSRTHPAHRRAQWMGRRTRSG
jgi:hypothetical protein